MLIQLAGIYPDMVFFNLNTSRDKLIAPENSIWKLFPSVLAKLSGQFLLVHVMIDTPDRKGLYTSSLFSSLFFLLWHFQFQIFRLWCLQVTDGFRFIKKYDRSIYFHEADLSRGRHFFTGPAKTGLLGKDQLFHHQLHLIIQCLRLFCQFFHLLLHSKKKLDQQLFVKFIQLFFCVLKCHNRNSCLFTGPDYNRFFVLLPIRSICPFGIMTVGNTSEKLSVYRFSDVLSTSDRTGCSPAHTGQPVCLWTTFRSGWNPPSQWTLHFFIFSILHKSHDPRCLFQFHDRMPGNNLQSLHQHTVLFFCDSHCLIGRSRPSECTAVKSFIHEEKSVPFPEKSLDPVGSSSAE